MNDNNLIECTYGHHLADKDKDFTTSGLNYKYYTICRKCNTEKIYKYRQKYRKAYNEKQKEYMKKWRSDKSEQINLEN